MITASALPRLATCPASALLAHEDYSTADAVAGTARHAEREALVLAGRADELPEAVAALIQEGDEVTAELAVAYSPSRDAGRILGRGIGRDYKVTGDEIPGTVDLVISGAGRLIVVDWKAHRDNGSREQLMLYALALARATGAESVTIAVHYESGRLVVREVDDLELDAFAAELRGIVARAVDPTELPRASSSCRYCPAFNACPEQRALAAQASGEALWLRVEATNLADDSIAADFYALTQRVDMLLKRMRAKLYARGAERAIPLPGGTVFGIPAAKQGSKVYDADKVYEVARKLHGQAFADDAVARESSEAAVKRAAKKHGLPPATVRAVLAAVDEAGGVSRREPSKTPTEHHPARPGESEAA